MLKLRHREQYALGVLAVMIATIVVYFGVIFPRDAGQVFPWSSDAWGHLVKAVYLREQIGDGRFYPDLFPSWYSGQQLLRYFPPISYYWIVGLNELTGNVFTAGNLFMFSTSLLGGLSFLLFAPRIGFSWAVFAGVLFVIFPDNLRVAFADGNLPRLAAIAFMPLLFYFLLNLVEDPRSRRNFIGVSVTMAVIVLSHAMMAGIFLVGSALYIGAYWLIVGGTMRMLVSGAGALLGGLLLSGWWLLPSLTGGISELDNRAASEAVRDSVPSVALNPGLRSGNNEAFYVGLVALLLLFVAAFMWKRLSHWEKALIVVTFVMTLIGTTFIVEFWRSLPGNQLLWPIRFMSFAAMGLVLTSVIVIRKLYVGGDAPERRWLRFAAVAVAVLLLIDSQPSLQLMRSADRPAAVQEISSELAVLDGWRVATADLSRLGSAPAMLFTTEGEREQVFGWAFQGSITGRLLARLNQSMTEGFLEFTLSRLDRLGADDVVILPQPGISPGLGDALEDDGFLLVNNSRDLPLYHRDGAPRAFSIPMKVLGIGTGTENASLAFPQIAVGSSPNLDDYSDEFLADFDTVLLAGFTTSNRGRAEERVRRLAGSGMQFVMEMTGSPTSPFSRQPKFLDVHGEPVLQISQAVLDDGAQKAPLMPFDDSEGPWRSVTPQGADEVLVKFEYPAAEGALIARNSYGDGSVTFIGLNLFFHVVKTRDPLAVDLLEGIIGLDAFEKPADRPHLLGDYVAGEDGWSFDIDLDEPGWVLFPMAHHDGTRVTVNGQNIDSTSIERLTFGLMPAGRSSVEIRSERTGIYTLGVLASVAGALLVAGLLFGQSPAVLATGARLRRLAQRRHQGSSEGARDGAERGERPGRADDPVAQA